MLRKLFHSAFTVVIALGAEHQAAVGQEAQPKLIRIISTAPPGAPASIAIDRLIAGLNERFGPNYRASAIERRGSPQAMLAEYAAEIAVVPTTDLSESTRYAFTLFDLPFLFQTTKEVDAVQKTSVGIAGMAALQRGGYVGLGYLNNGLNSLFTKTVPANLDTFKGQKIRVATQSGGSSVSQLGARPVVLPFAELSAALEMGAVDGLEVSNAFAVQSGGAAGIVARWSTSVAAATPLRPSVSALLMNDAMWRSLPYRIQSIIVEESQKASLVATEVASRQEADLSRTIAEARTVTQVSAESLAKAIQPAWLRAQGISPDDLKDTVLPIVESIRRANVQSPPSPDRRGAVTDPPVVPASAVGARGLGPGEVLFATDRAFLPEAEPRYRLQGVRGQLIFGIASFSINPSRKLGATDDAQSRMADLKIMTDVDFEKRLSDALSAAPKKEVVIFVHGFNNAFDSASRAMALISSDIHFGGIPVLYSWPSDGAAPRYGSDEEEVRASRDNFLRFVEKIGRTAGVQRLHIAAHSMGNRLMLEAIDKFDGISDKSVKLFHHAIMAAPDVYVGIFSPTVDAFLRRTGRLTLYASDKDTALLCSRKLHGGNRRLGEAGTGIFVAQGVETIDATEAEPPPSFLSAEYWPVLSWAAKTCDVGHAYMMRSVRVQADLQNLILSDLPPVSRPGLETKAKAGINYWAFRPSE